MEESFELFVFSPEYTQKRLCNLFSRVFNKDIAIEDENEVRDEIKSENEIEIGIRRKIVLFSFVKISILKKLIGGFTPPFFNIKN
jgi:hypothetical protein